MASAKPVLAMLDKPEPDAKYQADHLDVNALTEEEFRELESLFDPLEQFKAKIRARLAQGATPTALAFSSDDSTDTRP